jgi:hypothetical protein
MEKSNNMYQAREYNAGIDWGQILENVTRLIVKLLLSKLQFHPMYV